MDNKAIISILMIVPLLLSCYGNKPDITVVSEENSVGNSVIKWELSPSVPGNVKVYASLNPENIPEENPVAIAPINNNRLTVIPPDSYHRYYYKLVFNEDFSVTTANRNVRIRGIQNFRDLGGYETSDQKHIKWGMLYRSGKIDSLSHASFHKLKSIGIKTIIDLRTIDELQNVNHLQEGFNVIHIPISNQEVSHVLSCIRQGIIHGDTIRSVMEHMNKALAINFKREYRALIQTLLNEENYPVVFHGAAGKSRTGVVTAIILSILNIDHETIIEDYKLSNRFYNIRNASRYAYNLSNDSQEAITMIFSARRNFLEAAHKQIESEYGTVDNYVTKGLGLTQKEKEKLRSILLE